MGRWDLQGEEGEEAAPCGAGRGQAEAPAPALPGAGFPSKQSPRVEVRLGSRPSPQWRHVRVLSLSLRPHKERLTDFSHSPK